MVGAWLWARGQSRHFGHLLSRARMLVMSWKFLCEMFLQISSSWWTWATAFLISFLRAWFKKNVFRGFENGQNYVLRLRILRRSYCLSVIKKGKNWSGPFHASLFCFEAKKKCVLGQDFHFSCVYEIETPGFMRVCGAKCPRGRCAKRWSPHPQK